MMNCYILKCLRKSIATLAIILGISCYALNVNAQMPLDISYYTDEDIIKASTNDYNIDIEVKYLAFELGSANDINYRVLFLESPSGITHDLVAYPSIGSFTSGTKYTYIENDGYAFIDLQSIEIGDWHLRLVQSYAGNWYYTTQEAGENNTNISAVIDGLKYILNTETFEAKLSAHNYTGTEYSVPSTVEYESKTYTVTSLSANCFLNCSNIKTITLPSTITTIGNYCFKNCSNLKSLVLTSTIPPTYKGDIGLNNNVNIGVPSELIPTYESDDYWKQYHIRDMNNLPGDIITIDDNLMLQLYPQSQTATLLPNSYNSSDTFTVPETVTYDGVTYTVTALSNMCFFNCTKLQSVILPKTIKIIGSECFEACSALASINIPEGVMVLGDYCFYACRALASINIPEGVTALGDKCFSDCDALTTINLPEGVTALGDNCFYSCDALSFLEIPESVKSIGSNCFRLCNILQENGIIINSTTPPTLLGNIQMNRIYVPEEAVETYKANESWKDKTISKIDDFHYVDIEVNSLKYDIYIYKREAALVYNNYSSETVEIPGSVNYQGKTYSVTELSNRCFYNCRNLQSVVLPNTIKKIGSECFSDCGALTTINIPEGVTALGDHCFSYCGALTTINIPKGMTVLGDYCFYSCNALTTINIPEGVTALGDNCFADCGALNNNIAILSLTPPTISNSGIGISNIYVPEEVIELYEEDKNWSKYNIYSLNYYPGDVITIDGLKYQLHPYDGNNVGLLPNSYNRRVDFEVPETVVGEDGTVYTVTSLENDCFKDCNYIPNIVLPKTIKRLGNNCFGNCAALVSVNIPDGATDWGNGCFNGCSSLTSINIPEGVNELREYCFNGCTKLESINIPQTVKKLYKYCLAGTGISGITIPESITELPEGCFSECRNLITLTVPQNITSLGNSCFSGSGMTSINIHEGITTFPDGLFSNCYSIISFTVPEGVTELGENCFYGCSYMSNIKLPNTLTKIGTSCFSQCTDLSSLIIPENIESLGYDCFFNLHCLTYLAIKATNPPSASNLDIETSATLYVPEESINAYKTHLYWGGFTIKTLDEFPSKIVEVDNIRYLLYEFNTNATILSGQNVSVFDIPQKFTYEDKEYTVTKIGDNALSGYNSINYITIPNTVKTLGKNCFPSSLKMVSIPESVNYIDEGCFSNCTSNLQVEILTSVPPTRNGDIALPEGTTVFVREENMSAYENDEYWKNYTIKSLDELCIENVIVGDYKVNIYKNTKEATLLANNYNKAECIEIPATINWGDETYTITSIGDNCYNGCGSITQIVLPSTVQSIGEGCFSDCSSLSSIILNSLVPPTCSGDIGLPSNATIGVPSDLVDTYKNDSYWGTFNIIDKTDAIPDIVIVNGLKYELDKNNLTATLLSNNYNRYGEFVVPETLVYADYIYTITVLEDGCFRGCNGLKSIRISSNTPPTCKGDIGLNCITNVYVPVELLSTYESDNYWKQYYIRDINDLPGDIITTDDNLRLQLYPQSKTATLLSNPYNTSGTFTVPETVTYDGVTYTITALDEECFNYCTHLNSVVLPNTIKIIGNHCFNYCIALTTINIPERVTALGDNCFWSCSTLTTINIPEGVTALRDNCFYFCNALASINIPEGVTALGDNCFYHCDNLSSLIIPSSVTQIGNDCFDCCNSLQKIVVLSTNPPTISSLGSSVSDVYVPEESIVSYKSNENWKQYNILSLNRYPGETIEVDGLKYQLYPYNSQNVGLLQNGYNKEGTFTVPATVTVNENTYNVSYIEDDCFNGCSSITAFNFEGEIKAIGKNAFRECSQLKNFIVPEGITSLESYTFYNCNNLTNVTLPNSLQFIGDNCFNYCRSLKSIIIPKNVTYMGENCLYYTSITDVLMYPTTPPEANTGLGYSSATIYVHDDARNAYQNDAYWNQYVIKSKEEFPGVEITDGNYRYQLHIFNNDATLISASPDEMGIVNVPTAVTYDDKTYSVTVIGDNSLTNYDIRHVVLPEGIKKLGVSCFYSNLKVVNIPSTVEEIYPNCFSGCGNQLRVQMNAAVPTTSGDISLPSGATLYMSDDLNASYSNDEYWKQFTIKPSEDLYIDGISKDGCVYDVYLNKKEATLRTSDYSGGSEYTVKDAMTYNGEEYLTTAISDNCFFEKTVLESITLPSAITSLGDYCFGNCTSLTQITLPESLTSLGAYCFSGCSFSTITLPQYVTSVGSNCFYNCSNMTTLLIDVIDPPVCSESIGLSADKVTIFVPSESIDKYRADAVWGQFPIMPKEEYSFKEEVIDGIKYKLFNYNFKASVVANSYDKPLSYTIPESITASDGNTYTVTAIDVNAFKDCGSIIGITLPSSIVRLGDQCFAGCSSITSFTIPSNITTWGEYCFSGCTALKAINFEDGLTSLGDRTFNGCSSLKSVTIPDCITTIGEDCFANCDNLKSLLLTATTPPTCNTSLGLTGDATIYVESSLVDTYTTADVWKDYTILAREGFPGGEYTTNDGYKYIFYPYSQKATLIANNYNSNATITIPSSFVKDEITYTVNEIGNDCFSGCGNVTEIVINDNIESIAANSFDGCSALNTLMMNGSIPPSSTTAITLPNNAVIYVEDDDLITYQTSETWKQNTIKSKKEYAGLEEIVDTYKYRLYPYAKEATLIANGYDKPLSYTIPESITASDGNTYTVTAIDENAFKDCGSIIGITLPSSIVRLGDQCFAGCSSITSFTIPNSITSWGEYCFSGCTALKAINFEDGLTSLGDRTFNGCSSLKSVTIPDCITTIGEDCFANCDNLKSLLLTATTPPTCNTSLGLAGDATIYVESSLVDTYTTADVWKDYTIASREGYPAGEYTTSDGYKYIYYPYSLKGTLIANNYNSNTTFNVPKSFEKDGDTYTVNAIGENCFAGCDIINEIAIPSSINNVAANCFEGCNSLKSLMMEGAIPPSSTSVIYLPNSAVIYVDDANLQTYKANETWNQNTIKSKMEYAGQEVEVGGLKYLLYPYAGEACLLQNNYDKPEPITIASTFTYAGKSYTVTAIGNDCFKNCGRITGITIPETVTRLGDQCFAGCSSITAITIPNSITSWGEYCFLGCGGLKDITLSEGLSSIGKYAFYNCGALKEITIPESITSIGEGVFANCYEMEKILMTSTTPPTCSGELGLRSEAKVYVPEDVVDVYKGTNYWTNCNITSRADYPIGDYVIDGLKYTLYPYSQKATLVANSYSDTKIDIPSNVAYEGVSYTVDKIADNCFYGCNNLTEVVLPETIISIGDNCFAYCNALTTVLSLASTPPVCTGNLALESSTKIYVANEDIETYQNDINWGQNKVESYDKFAVETIADRGEFKYRLYPFIQKATLLGNSYSNSSIEVPKTTVYDGKTYQVTGIGKYCFYTNSNLTEIILPNTITTIEDWAFAECSNLVKLTLPENVTNIGQNVFKKTSKLENIKCLATTPPTCTGDLLFKDGAIIYVPAESVDTYKRAMYWEVYEIKSIDDFVDGIYSPNMDADSDVKIYDLNGLRLETKGKGLRILRSKGKSKKVVIK